MTSDRPSVGVAVVVWKDDQILIGKDYGKGGDPVFGVPGGHWEHGESLDETAEREVREEASIQIGTPTLESVFDFYREDKDKSYVTIGFSAPWKEGIPRPESDETRKEWDWYDPESLPQPMFDPDVVLVERSLSEEIYSIE